MAVRMLRSSLMLRSLFFLLLLLWNLNAAHAARGFRHNTRHGQSALYGMNKSLKNSGLFPSTFNVAAKADIFVNATCGEEGPETFCKPSESSRCAVCDARSPDPGKKHNISNILDSSPGKWWQSPTLARGEHYEYVTIALDLKQVYQIEYVIVKAANSPRPAAWILEKSIDGENFQPWQYYAPSDEECWTRYSVPPVTGKPIYIGDDDVICTSVFSRQTPMENGEIHTHLVNGRPGALNHSTTLQEFTQARYVRLRLQGLRRSGETIADKRRAFYSIKEINIGGRCVCSGHAARCRYSVQHGHQECECERHTCGERCEKCCPMYNQIPWKPGTAAKGFHCEKCNCNGHATSCRYDQDVADRRMSMDIRGKFRGGGVCINCTEHTAGINCEKCQVNYYRPNGVAPDDPEPCVPCDCNEHGSTGYCTPDDSYVHIGKVAGACDCKPGYSGYKCDQCAAGYRQFPDCMPCPCDSRGILPSHDCEGNCLCKANVAGELCDQCKPGHFALTKENLDGCLPCYCFGVSDHCGTAKLSYSTISSLENWLVTDVNATRAIVPILDTDNGWLTIAAFDVEYDSPFWLAPRIYCGNRLSSYGSNLTYSVSWVVMRGDTSGRPTTGPNVVLVGNNGMRIAYGEEQYNGQEAEITVPLREDGWYHVRGEIQDIPTRLRRTEFRGDAVTRIQMMKVLADLKYLMIRAQYHSEQIEGSLQSAVVSVGDVSSSGENNNLVEKCECPEGYTGLSCENCAWGYVKLIQNGSDHQNHHVCVKCDCNGHASTCDLVLGECTTCEHNTVGPKCDRCAPGFYGIALKGTSDDCKRCACPLLIETNNFSPNCQLDDPTDIDSGYVCTQCPKGYTGDHCESCDIGFFGNPLVPGGTCEPCFCGGGPCDQETGRCLECRGNTEGWKCDKCKPAHYGNPLEQNCLPCNCDPLGTSSIECDEKSGQCPCKPLFEGRDCSSCIEGYGNVTAGCRECDCDVGALDEICDPVTGECRCTEGVLGFRCDHCDIDHYGLSTEGCKDEVKILKSFWIDNPRLNIATVYDMACEYALEENINYLWVQLPREVQHIFSENIYTGYKCLILAYWQCCRDGNLSLFIRYLETAIQSGRTYIHNRLYNRYHSIEENMFRLSVYGGYSKAVEYFWDKLNEEERNRNGVSGIQISITSYVPDYAAIGESCYKQEKCVEICIFLINQVRADNKTKTIARIVYDSFEENIYICGILRMILLTWPWQEFLGQILDELEAALKAQKNGYTGLNLLLVIISCMKRDYNLGYVIENSKYGMILHEVWRKIPACLKAKIAETDPYLDLIQDLLEIWHLPSIKLIINAPEMTQWRKKLLDSGYILCVRIGKLIKIGQYELLNQFIEEILVTEKEKKLFKQAINIWDYFINEDQYDLADKLLDWQSDSIEERENLKSKINHIGLCLNFIKEDQYKLADKLLDWKFSTREARQVCKDSFKNNKSSHDYIYRLWVVEKDNVEIAQQKSLKFLNWFLHSEEEIVWFKKHSLVNDRLEEVLCELFIENNCFETIEYFLDWCLLSKEEIQKLKQVVVNRKIFKKCKCNIMWNYIDIAEKFIKWAFDEEVERTKFIRQFVLSNEGIACCAGFIAGARESTMDSDMPTLHEAVIRFNNFIDFWIKPLRNVDEMKDKLREYIFFHGTDENIENYEIFMNLLDNVNPTNEGMDISYME